MDESHVFDFNLEGQMGEGGERGREGGRERERFGSSYHSDRKFNP